MEKKKKKQIYLHATIIGIVLLLAWVLGSGRAYASDSVNYQIQNYQIMATVGQDGSIHVEEFIKYHFDEEMNGLSRKLVYAYQFKGQKNELEATSSRYQAEGIENLKVYVGDTKEDLLIKEARQVSSAANGQNGVYTQTNLEISDKKGYEVKVYSPITTDKKYVRYSYDIKNACVKYNDIGEFYYNFVGPEWDCTIYNLAISIDFMGKMDQDKVMVFPHTYASEIREVQKEADQYRFIVPKVSSGTAVDARVVFPQEAISRATKVYPEDSNTEKILKIEERMTKERQRYQDSFHYYILIVLAGIITTILFILIGMIKARSRKESKRKVEYYRDIPSRLKLEEYNTIVLQQMGCMDVKLLTATILDLINKKVLSLETKKKAKNIFNSSEYEYYLTYHKSENFGKLCAYEKQVLGILFFQNDGKRFREEEIDGETVELNESLKKFSKARKDVIRYSEKQKKKGEEKKKKIFEVLYRKIIYSYNAVIGILVAIYLLMFFIYSPANMDIKGSELIIGIFVFAIILVIGNAFIVSSLTVVKEEYREDQKQLLGLKRYLKDYSKIKERYPIEIALWDRYLVFATLLGIADKVSKEIKDELVKQGFDDDYIYMHYPIVCMSVYSSSINSYASTYTGSSTGGYSGGGSGGGGGRRRRRWSFLKKRYSLAKIKEV